MRPGRILLFAAFLAAPGHAGITGISVSPTPATPGHAVTISVNGSGPCTFDLELGENGAKTTLSGSLPKTTEWVYLSTGSKTLTATGKTPCTGRVQTTLQVLSPLVALCQKANCASLALAIGSSCKPEIKSVWSAATPGAEILVMGSCFIGGGGPATLTLVGQFPGGAVTITPIEWKHGYVRGLIPESITGVPDQKVKARIVKHNMDWAESAPFDFMARREMRILSGKDVTMNLDFGQGSNGGCESSDWNDPAFTVDCGWHNPPVDYDNDTGTDKMIVSLKGGWRTHHRLFHWSSSMSEGHVSGNDGFQANVGNLTLSYKWVTDDDPWLSFGDSSYTYYDVTVFIEGPVGISWK